MRSKMRIPMMCAALLALASCYGLDAEPEREQLAVQENYSAEDLLIDEMLRAGCRRIRTPVQIVYRRLSSPGGLLVCTGLLCATDSLGVTVYPRQDLESEKCIGEPVRILWAEMEPDQAWKLTLWLPLKPEI